LKCWWSKSKEEKDMQKGYPWTGETQGKEELGSE
jgi:hypothetical protein